MVILKLKQKIQNIYPHIFSMMVFYKDHHLKIIYLFYIIIKLKPGHPKQLSESKCILVYLALQSQQN